VVPYAERLLQNCASFGVTALTVVGADYCEENLEKFDKRILFKTLDVQIKLNMGQPVLFLGMGRWHEYPLEAVAEYLAGYKESGVRATVIGGINARLLRDGPVEAIVDNIRRYVTVLGRDHDLSFFLANIPADTPPEHIHAAVAAAHGYGAQPRETDLGEVEIDVPKRESFQDFCDRMSNGLGLRF